MFRTTRKGGGAGPNLPLPARVIRLALKSGLRGRTRLAFLGARLFKSLREVPLLTASGDVLYADLRIISSHDLLAGKEWEEGEQEVMRRVVSPGQHALDVGAHIGVHTLLLSRLVGEAGRVYAFEPQPDVLPALRRTLDALPNVSLYTVALSDRDGVTDFYVPGDHSMASLADWTGGGFGDVSRIECETRRLDALITSRALPPPDFIKCDVEGAEFFVFGGARESLNSEGAPVILFEANAAARGFGLDPSSAMGLLASLELPRYEFFEVRGGGAVSPIKALEAKHYNLLAIPRARARIMDNLTVR